MQCARSLDLFWNHHWVSYTELLGLDRCRTRNHWAWTPSYPLWWTKYPTSVSSHTTSDWALPATVVSQSRLHVYMMKSSLLLRGSPTWVDQTCTHVCWTYGPTAHPVIFSLLKLRSCPTSCQTTPHPNHSPRHGSRPCLAYP